MPLSSFYLISFVGILHSRERIRGLGNDTNSPIQSLPNTTLGATGGHNHNLAASAGKITWSRSVVEHTDRPSPFEIQLQERSSARGEKGTPVSEEA